MIYFENVTKTYNDSTEPALKEISFKIKKGEFVFLVGETGAGKTTVTRLISAEESADSGIVKVLGTNVFKLSKKDLPFYRREIGMVFQDYRLFLKRTVFENVAVAMEIVGTPRKNINHMVPQILEIVGLSHKSNAMPDNLSGGEQQRVAIARAMANNPPILVADEPTGNLDPKTSVEIMHILKRFNKLGTTVLVATHAHDIVDKMQKRVIELKSGAVIRDEKSGSYLSKGGVL